MADPVKLSRVIAQVVSVLFCNIIPSLNSASIKIVPQLMNSASIN